VERATTRPEWRRFVRDMPPACGILAGSCARLAVTARKRSRWGEARNFCYPDASDPSPADSSATEDHQSAGASDSVSVG